MKAGSLQPDRDEGQLRLERSERLAYLADMLGEFRELAAREGCAVLAALIALAQIEAQAEVSGARAQKRS